MRQQILQAQRKGGWGFRPSFPNGLLGDAGMGATLPPGPRARLHRTQAALTTARTMARYPSHADRRRLPYHGPFATQWGAVGSR